MTLCENSEEFCRDSAFGATLRTYETLNSVFSRAKEFRERESLSLSELGFSCAEAVGQFRCQLPAVDGQMVCRDLGVCLLLIVNRDVLELFAFRSRTAHRGSAALAVGRDHSPTCGDDFAVFLSGELQCPIIHLRVRACI